MQLSIHPGSLAGTTRTGTATRHITTLVLPTDCSPNDDENTTMNVPPNPYALQRTRPVRTGCNARLPRAGSMRLLSVAHFPTSHFVTLLLLFICVSRGICDDQITYSARKTFKIVQRYHDHWTETLEFTKRSPRPIILERGNTWPALFYISPDEQWILRVQKAGSGVNTSFLYRVESNHRVSRIEEQIDDLAFAFLGLNPDGLPEDLYHTGIEFTSWDLKTGSLHFTIHASSHSEKGIDRALVYKLHEHTIVWP